MNLQDYISQLSDKYRIPSQLVFTIAKIATNTQMMSSLFDPTHRWLWDCQGMRPFRNLTDDETLSACAPQGFNHLGNHLSNIDTEYTGQKTAWGPFLLKGSHARAAGFYGPFPSLCTEPDKAVHFFLIHMSKLRDRYFEKHGWAGVAAAYDAGRPRKDKEGRYVNRDYLIQLTHNGARGLINYT